MHRSLFVLLGLIGRSNFVASLCTIWVALFPWSILLAALLSSRFLFHRARAQTAAIRSRFREPYNLSPFSVFLVFFRISMCLRAPRSGALRTRPPMECLLNLQNLPVRRRSRNCDTQAGGGDPFSAKAWPQGLPWGGRRAGRRVRPCAPSRRLARARRFSLHVSVATGGAAWQGSLSLFVIHTYTPKTARAIHEESGERGQGKRTISAFSFTHAFVRPSETPQDYTPNPTHRTLGAPVYLWFLVSVLHLLAYSPRLPLLYPPQDGSAISRSGVWRGLSRWGLSSPATSVRWFERAAGGGGG